MLTIDEIKNISFRKATLSGGYRAEDVDAFIEDVIASFEQLKKEKTNLVHKIDRLATRLEEYRADEETVRNALLTSQKMSDACIKEAKDKAARILRDAEEKAQALSMEANKMTALEKENYLQLQADAGKSVRKRKEGGTGWYFRGITPHISSRMRTSSPYIPSLNTTSRITTPAATRRTMTVPSLLSRFSPSPSLSPSPSSSDKDLSERSKSLSREHRLLPSRSEPPRQTTVQE